MSRILIETNGVHIIFCFLNTGQTHPLTRNLPPVITYRNSRPSIENMKWIFGKAVVSGTLRGLESTTKLSLRGCAEEMKMKYL